MSEQRVHQWHVVETGSTAEGRYSIERCAQCGRERAWVNGRLDPPYDQAPVEIWPRSATLH